MCELQTITLAEGDSQSETRDYKKELYQIELLYDEFREHQVRLLKYKVPCFFYILKMNAGLNQYAYMRCLVDESSSRRKSGGHRDRFFVLNEMARPENLRYETRSSRDNIWYLSSR